MADTTISGLTRQSSIFTRGLIPVSIDGTTVGVPISSILAATGDLGTGFHGLPAGTTADRVGLAPSTGAIRWNTTINNIEYFNGTAWSTDLFSFDYLIVAGGGGGGGAYAGGGGAGGNGHAVGAAGTTNTGGGGGGGGRGYPTTYYYSGGNGGSGIVKIRYSGNSARATGGTISYIQGYVYHTFTNVGSTNFNWNG